MSRNTKTKLNKLQQELEKAGIPNNPYAVPARQRRAGAHKDKDEKRSKNKEARYLREWDGEDNE